MALNCSPEFRLQFLIAIKVEGHLVIISLSKFEFLPLM